MNLIYVNENGVDMVKTQSSTRNKDNLELLSFYGQVLDMVVNTTSSTKDNKDNLELSFYKHVLRYVDENGVDMVKTQSSTRNKDNLELLSFYGQISSNETTSSD